MLCPEPFTRTGPTTSGLTPQNRTNCVLKIFVRLWYAFCKPPLNLENHMTVCMGYTAMTPQGRAGQRRREGVGSPCRENGTSNLKSRWYAKPEATVPVFLWNPLQTLRKPELPVPKNQIYDIIYFFRGWQQKTGSTTSAFFVLKTGGTTS